MQFDGRWLDWLAVEIGGGSGEGMEVWLNNAAIASAVVVAVSNVFMARVMYQLYHHRSDHFRSPQVLVLFAGVLALCGLSHLALLLDHATALRAASLGLRLVAAGLWVAAAIRFPVVLDRLTHPHHAGRRHDLDPSVGAAAAALSLVESELTLVNQRLRALECLIRSDVPSCESDDDSSDSLCKALDDLKAGPCKT